MEGPVGGGEKGAENLCRGSEIRGKIMANRFRK
jgi:hypothetical protein